jgi:hypothetical protein
MSNDRREKVVVTRKQKLEALQKAKLCNKCENNMVLAVVSNSLPFLQFAR